MVFNFVFGIFKKIALFDFLLMCLLSAVAVFLFFFITHLNQSALSRAVAKEIYALESASYLFHEAYDYFPGDMPNATNYWSVDDFNTKCTYWDSIRGEKIPFVKGANGNGDGKVYWANDVAYDKYIIAAENTDTFYEITGLPCHLVLAKMLTTSRVRPVVFNAFSDASYQKISGIKMTKNNLITAHHDKEKEYTIIFSGMHTWHLKKNDRLHSALELHNAYASVHQLYMIDKKIDDGLPGSGNVQCTTVLPNKNLCEAHYTDSLCNDEDYDDIAVCCDDYDIVENRYRCKKSSNYDLLQVGKNVGYLEYLSSLMTGMK